MIGGPEAMALCQSSRVMVVDEDKLDQTVLALLFLPLNDGSHVEHVRSRCVEIEESQITRLVRQRVRIRNDQISFGLSGGF